MSKQTTTGGSTTTRKSTRVPVTTRNKALATGISTSRVADTMASRKKSRIDDSARHAMIAQAAYFRAERRGFAHGGEINDWLEAEREISRMLES